MIATRRVVSDGPPRARRSQPDARHTSTAVPSRCALAPSPARRRAARRGHGALKRPPRVPPATRPSGSAVTYLATWRHALPAERGPQAARRGAVDLAPRSCRVVAVTPEELADLAHLRRARDLIDREYARPLDVPAMAAAALMSPAHFSRKFRAAYGETPYSYLMTRRIERAKALLRQGKSVTSTCAAVGCTSLGSFSARFSEIVGETPSLYRARDHAEHEAVPPCVSRIATRPRRTRVPA